MALYCCIDGITAAEMFVWLLIKITGNNGRIIEFIFLVNSINSKLKQDPNIKQGLGQIL